MKKNISNKISNLVMMLALFLVATSCSEDDLTGNSTLVATSPSISVTLDFANTQTLIEEETSYGFTVTLSEPQIADVRVNLSQIGGTATNGEDFSIPTSVTIPRGATSVSDVIEIHEDDLVEDTETAIIKIATGTETNVSAVSSQTVTFNIVNLIAGDLEIGLSWDAQVTQVDGSLFDPTDLADLRLLITDVPYTNIIDTADDAGFESLTLTSSSPDGEYYVVADWYNATDLGVQGDFPVSLTTVFNQIGVINNMSFSFEDALDSANSCSSVYYVMAKITKTGENYDITEVAESSPITVETFVGMATITADDWADYSVGDQITLETGTNDNEFWIRTYTNPYISNTASAYMIVTVDPTTGNATVLSNEDFDYGCSEGDVTGSGIVNACAGTIDLLLNYDLGDCGSYPDQAFSLQL